VTKNNPQEGSIFLEKTNLMKLRSKALRSGLWFRALTRIDRVLVDLTIKVMKTEIRSCHLINRVLSVTSKLEALLENKLSRTTKNIGIPLACKLKCLAESWGNRLACAWNTQEFARFLAVLKLNAAQNS
jgi:hypothetical protein